MPRKDGVNYVKPEEPAFLKKFKQKVGYTEQPTVDAKRGETRRPGADSDEDDEDDDPLVVRNEDEKPVVVQLSTGDLSQEEASDLFTKKDGEETKSPDDNAKIMFKKPAKKRTSSESMAEAAGLTTSTSNKKLKTEDESESETKTKRKSKRKSEMKKVRNKCLLSFDEED